MPLADKQGRRYHRQRGSGGTEVAMLEFVQSHKKRSWVQPAYMSFLINVALFQGGHCQNKIHLLAPNSFISLHGTHSLNWLSKEGIRPCPLSWSWELTQKRRALLEISHTLRSLPQYPFFKPHSLPSDGITSLRGTKELCSTECQHQSMALIQAMQTLHSDKLKKSGC